MQNLYPLVKQTVIQELRHALLEEFVRIPQEPYAGLSVA
jgi:hypothetical protein